MTGLRRSPHTLRLRRAYGTMAAASAKRVTIGIRREDPARIWERRCPLTPDVVHELVHKDGVEVLVQPCERRVFTANDFIRAGAKLHPTLQPAHVVVGIKETPLPEVLTDPLSAPGSPHNDTSGLVPRTHVMFSHTVKGQLYNMELLGKYLASENPHAVQGGALLPRLIDYELLTGEDGKRTVGFGWFAGVAGALESLVAMAHAHLELGVASPFLWTPRPHTHPSLASIRKTLRDVVGAQIASDGTPKSLGPLVIGVTGTGNVAQGCLDLLQDLPIQHIGVDQLRSIVTDPNTDLRKIYVVHALPKDYFGRKDGRAFDRSDYYAHPDQYVSEFHTKIAPYLSLLLHGAGWAPTYPRLMTNEQLTTTLEIAQTLGKGRFACVGDISCDVNGGLEFLSQYTTLCSPTVVARPPTLPAHLPSVTMMAVDILPTALPLEASQHFSGKFLPYLRSIISSYTSKEAASEEERLTREALERATVASGGELRTGWEWLRTPLGAWKESVVSAQSGEVSGKGKEREAASGSQPKKTVLMLGSGMVAPPAVQELCGRSDVQVIVASNVLADAERLTLPYANATPVLVDMANPEAVERLVAAADVVISLLPVPFHPSVAELCIRHRKHLVTASYISPAMRALHDRAVSADVVLMNEIGLDPGIDHCSAMSLIDSLREQGKEIVSFTSFCGGLPAPEDADVPLGYKFSWSPKGVLTAASNSALFKLHGERCEIDGEDLLRTYFPDVPLSNVLKFEGLANRNSLPYAGVYSLEPLVGIRTIFRGTLRYPGFADLMYAFKAIGLLDVSATVNPQDWQSLVRATLEQKLGIPILDETRSLRSALQDVIPPKQQDSVLDALHWLSIIPQSTSEHVPSKNFDLSLPPLPSKPTAPIDLFATLLAHKLRYAPNERDLVVLSHEIVARPKGSRVSLTAPSADEEVHTSSLVTYGTRDASAMSRTVGLPVAFAALQILDGGVSARGVQGPTSKEVYGNVLRRLEEVGLGMRETVRKVTARTALGLSVEESLWARWRAMQETV
ncbi:Saccharopine dehydrogenase-domain-containing protein [Dichomitus squalens]|uniref:Saccharopine dehydrogenase-domain-containing protein n=1 Tax=Dichomitus squalens TaxID=114155 RepID=A0A4Q9PKV7_9APHY|nr:Saccharopine dehydrogenase-domain-containing protein [Dichomitus squalens]